MDQGSEEKPDNWQESYFKLLSVKFMLYLEHLNICFSCGLSMLMVD
jgi:hypothetical protein